MFGFGARRACLVACALGVVIAGVASPGRAADGWRKPISLGRIVPVLHLTDLSVGVRGDAAAAWAWKQRKAPFAYRVQVATSKRGHGWRRAATFFAGNHGDVDGPHVVVDRDGLVTMLWAEGANGADSSHCSVRVASGEVGSEWSRYRVLSRECALSTQLTVDGQGDVVAAWQSLDTDLPMYATRVHGHSWSSPATVPHAQRLTVRGLATNEAGTSTMVLAGDGHDTHGVYAVRRHRTSGWSKRVRISRAQPLVGPQVAESAKGDVTVLWSRARKRILTASLPVHGHWTKARKLARGDPSRIEYTGRTVLAVWESVPGSTMFAVKPPRAPWKSAVNISGTSKRNQDPDVSADEHGRVTVVWSNFYTGHIQARTRAKNRLWSEIQTVTATGYGTSPFVASRPGGHTWITWRSKNRDGKFRAKAARQD